MGFCGTHYQYITGLERILRTFNMKYCITFNEIIYFTHQVRMVFKIRRLRFFIDAEKREKIHRAIDEFRFHGMIYQPFYNVEFFAIFSDLLGQDLYIIPLKDFKFKEKCGFC
jgi:hypothetical protein